MSNTRTLVIGAFVLALSACGDGGERKSIADQIGPASKKTSELKTDKKSEMTPEELAEARRKAGFVDPKELAEKNMAEMEKGEREFVKTRLAEYRKLSKDFRDRLTELQAEGAKWEKAKDPQKAFDKFAQKFTKPARALMKEQVRLSENNARGGKTNELLITALRSWDELVNELTPETPASERYPEAIKEIGEQLDKIDAALDEIEKDEDLVVNKFYKEKEGEEEGGAE
ncbi:MAG: hypothetical protein H6711_29030 [Myxococcales bacterium]|nr:hypothetical protein [Myxococcales bacterium]